MRQYKTSRLSSQGLEGSRIGGGGHTIRTGSGEQKFIRNPGLLLTCGRCCGGHLQTDVVLNGGQAQSASCQDEGFTREIHKTIEPFTIHKVQS